MGLNIAISSFVFFIISTVLYVKGFTAIELRVGEFGLLREEETLFETDFESKSFSRIQCGSLCLVNNECKAFAFDSETNKCIGLSERCQGDVTSLTPTTQLYQDTNENIFGCDVGWTGFNQSCYFFGTENVNWFRAAEICRSNHEAYLLTLETNAEYAFIKTKARAFQGSYWNGGNDLENEGTYTWESNGQPITVTYWNPSEPNGGTNENCIVMWSGTDYTYHDNPCVGTLWQYICEKKFCCH